MREGRGSIRRRAAAVEPARARHGAGAVVETRRLAHEFASSNESADGENARRAERILARGDASQVLARLVDGDPLRLFERSALRIRVLALLLDPTRAHLRACARIALLARQRESGAGVATWLDARIDEACRQLAAEDLERERDGGVPSDDEEREHAFVAQLLCVEPALARARAVEFNALDERPRRAFFALAIEGASVEQCLALGLGPAERLREDVRTACTALALFQGHRSNGVRSR